MKMVKLSDFYPYDRNKGGIQELHHKIESKTLQYWGEDSGILIGITPIYKRRLWSEEVKVVNDKMTNMKTRTYEGLKHRYMSFAISLTEHDSVQLLDDDSREESGSGTYYERECDALFDIDGRGNTERLVARNPKLRNLLEDGEYIPSLGQLNLMAHYMDELNKAFTYVSASPLSSTWYWSSTESSQAVAWYVVFSSGLTGTGNKHIGDMVRTVIDF